MMSMKAAAAAAANSLQQQQQSFDDLLSLAPSSLRGPKPSSQPHRLPQQVAHGTAKYASS
jgi:hypothetical protein